MPTPSVEETELPLSEVQFLLTRWGTNKQENLLSMRLRADDHHADIIIAWCIDEVPLEKVIRR